MRSENKTNVEKKMRWPEIIFSIASPASNNSNHNSCISMSMICVPLIDDNIYNRTLSRHSICQVYEYNQWYYNS